MEDPPKGFKRLVPGGEVRLRGAYVIKCEDVIYNGQGEVVELRCTHDDKTLGKKPEGRKVKGVIHWVSASEGLPAEVRLYDRLFTDPEPDAEGNFIEFINPDSLKTIKAKLEPALAGANPGERIQFERNGYFFADPIDSTEGAPVFNRIVPLRDAWAKIAKQK